MMWFMKAYSLDLRERILKARDEGATQMDVAKRFEVSQDTVQRYERRRRQTGSVGPTPRTGRVPKIKPEQHQQLRELVASRTDWSLQSISDAWREKTGVDVSANVLCKTCRRVGITFKKNPKSPPSETP